jgi:hypothetical protein
MSEKFKSQEQRSAKLVKNIKTQFPSAEETKTSLAYHINRTPSEKHKEVEKEKPNFMAIVRETTEHNIIRTVGALESLHKIYDCDETELKWVAEAMMDSFARGEIEQGKAFEKAEEFLLRKRRLEGKE